MFLQSNKAFTRVMKHARDTNRRVPVKHLYNNDIRPPIRELEDAGLLNVHFDKQNGYSINLSKQGYKEAISILGSAFSA